jgi:hypothetical protein
LSPDFSDDDAWEALKAAINAEDEHGEATFVSDPAGDGVTVQSLIDGSVVVCCRPSSGLSLTSC